MGPTFFKCFLSSTASRIGCTILPRCATSSSHCQAIFFFGLSVLLFLSFFVPILWGHIAVPSVTRCRCCRCCRCCCGHQCAGGVRQWWRATVATPGEWQCGVRRLAVTNGPNIFKMLLVLSSLACSGGTVKLELHMDSYPRSILGMSARMSRGCWRGNWWYGS